MARSKAVKKERGFWGEVAKEFKKNKGAVVGTIVFSLIIVVAVGAVFLLDYREQITKVVISEARLPISSEHFFGTDQYGRDIFLRILYGAHYSLLIGLCAVVIATVIGSLLGIIAGYFGGFWETIIMRFMDVISPIPTVMLALCIASAFGQSLVSLMLAVGVVSVPSFARIARAAVMTVRDQ